MQKWQREREEKLADLTLGAHVIAYLIAVVIFICNEPIQLNNLYTSTLKFVGILLPAAIFILLDAYFLHRNSAQRSVMVWNVAKHLALFLLITLVVSNNYKDGDLFASLYLLPVVLSCFTLGRNWGLVFAAGATGYLIVLTSTSTGATNILIEMPLILGGIFFLAAWFLGGIIEVEKKTTAELSKMAHEDNLTGLANHRSFHEQLNWEVEKALKNDAPLSLILLDIDFFKRYNDTYGHRQGDRIIAEMGTVLQGSLPHGAFLARYGGEEFAVILPAFNLQRAAQVARELHQTVENHTFSGGNSQPFDKLTVSVGVACLPDHACNLQELLDAADEALFSSKWTGRNKVRCYLAVLEKLSNNAEENDLELIHSLRTLMTVVNARDRYTYGHSERVAFYAGKVGETMELSLDDLRLLEFGAFLHDVGKLEIPREILNKTGSLSTAEWDFIRQHPDWGAEILKPVKTLQPVISMVRHHHENYDGSGYPAGLKGLEIPLFARILRVVDSYDAMTTNRPYRKALSRDEALQELECCAAMLYDPQVVDAFQKTLQKVGKNFSVLDYF